MATGKKRRSMFVWVLMGFLMLGLGGYGVTEMTSAGMSGVATVGESKVTANDYARQLRRQLNQTAIQLGRHVPLSEAREMGLPQMVQQQLLAGAALAEEARILGLSVGDRSVASALMAEPAFRGLDGRFDANRYADVLRSEGMTAPEFEAGLRMDETRALLIGAVAGGVDAPRPLIDRTVSWILQSRDIDWIELTAADLPEAVALPDEAALRAWHEANADRFTAPEVRHLTVAWLTPDMLQDSVMVDEQALRDLYDQHLAEFQQPERRLLGRLVYPGQEAAEAAMAQAEAGASFADLAAARGLGLADTELGEMTEDQLGMAGAEVFAAQDNGIIGPIQTELGPALFAVNAILDPVDIPFEEAREDLRAEAAADQARRVIEKRAEEVADLVAGGAALEDLAETAEMRVESLDWQADQAAAPGSIAAYPAFRDAAAAAQADAFPELVPTEDGGIFTLRLDSVTPPTLIPFEEARAAVERDWLVTETHRRLLALAETRRDAIIANEAPTPVAGGEGQAAADEAQPAAEPAPVLARAHRVEGLLRDGFVEGAPLALVSQAFTLTQPGETEIVDAEGRVLLVTLRDIHAADLEGADAQAVAEAIGARIRQSLADDVADSWLRAALAAHGARVDAAAIARTENLVQ